jgi:alcohol dehydrogenase class IV
MRFEFTTSDRIIFGRGTISKIGAHAAKMGSRAFVVTGVMEACATYLLPRLSDNGIESKIFTIDEEPNISIIQQGVNLSRESECDMIVGFGGGSAIDAGKAIAALMTNEGDLLDYLEVIGHGHPIGKSPLPYIAIPTTAGTGAEVTRNAVIGSPDHKVKVSLRSMMMYPKLAVIDPELTYSLPPKVTASTGMDALTQVLEPYVSSEANPLTDAICKQGMCYASHSLIRAYQDGQDQEAREMMSLVSLFGGLSLANAKLGAVHGFAGPIGGMYDAPHGAICASLLPPVMAANIKTIKARQPDHHILQRFYDVARLLTGDENAKAEDGVAWVHELRKELRIPPLSFYGVKQNDFTHIIDQTIRSSSIKGNPIELTPDELFEILDEAVNFEDEI